MRNFLQARLQKHRSPPLVHSWNYWHDNQQAATTSLTHPAPPTTGDTTATPSNTSARAYEDRLQILAPIDDIRSFWNLFNNYDVSRLQLRDSVHLFKKGVKPVWEDPRNAAGGAWTFRVPKAHAADVWKDVCMMAIGEQLQAAVESEDACVKDDICGVSLSVRFTSVLVQVWNRDAGHEAGVQRIWETVSAGLSEGLMPQGGRGVYYKKHREHAGFAAGESGEGEGEVPNGGGDGAEKE